MPAKKTIESPTTAQRSTAASKSSTTGATSPQPSRTRTGAASKSPAPTAKESTKTITNKRASRPTYEEVARRAFEIYEARGGEHGRDQEDWDAAEAELGKPAEPAAKTKARDRKSANGDPSGTASMDA